jgi:predicted nucleic acid-binding protein
LTRYVVDASVAVKWFVPEVLTEHAGLLRDHELVAVDHILVEVASALLHNARSGYYEASRFPEDIRALSVLLEFHDNSSLIEEAFQSAVTHGTSLYDSLYLVLALENGCRLVTADRRFYDAVRAAYPDTLLWLGDVTTESL